MEMIERRWKPWFLIRKLRRPRHQGQRRYIAFSYSKNNDIAKSDPGYLLALSQIFRHRYSLGLLIKEEIVVANPDGHLCWVTYQNNAFSFEFFGVNNLRQTNKLRRRLQREPLGDSIEQEVSDNGMLLLYRNERRSRSYASSQPEERQFDRRSFDVTDPEQAKEAIAHYQQLEDDIATNTEQIIEVAIKNIENNGTAKEKELFSDREVLERKNQAQRFARALAVGNIERVQDDLAQKKEEARARASKEREEHDYQMSVRAQRTLRSLSNQERQQ